MQPMSTTPKHMKRVPPHTCVNALPLEGPTAGLKEGRGLSAQKGRDSLQTSETVVPRATMQLLPIAELTRVMFTNPGRKVTFC